MVMDNEHGPAGGGNLRRALTLTRSLEDQIMATRKATTKAQRYMGIADACGWTFT